MKHFSYNELKKQAANEDIEDIKNQILILLRNMDWRKE